MVAHINIGKLVLVLMTFWFLQNKMTSRYEPKDWAKPLNDQGGKLFLRKGDGVWVRAKMKLINGVWKASGRLEKKFYRS